MTKEAHATATAADERTKHNAPDPANPQRREPGEKPRDKPVEEEADKDIKQNAEDIRHGA